MILVLHGEAAGWDELLIALVALAVLWIGVKLAGRKPAAEDDDEAAEAAAEAGLDIDQDHQDPVPPAASKPS
ncbi:MAG: hypothetical protein LC797_16705 [Chloroflexi bacterium]|nr:hypothetical protein [Chloroflexota bacterium]